MEYVKIPGSTSQSQQIAAMNNNFSQLANESITKVYNDVNGIPNISIGLQRDGSSRIRIARQGIDVNEATDDQLVFNSAQNVLKVVASGTFSVTYSAVNVAGPIGRSVSMGSHTITHNLSYSPMVQFYTNYGGTEYKPVAHGSILTNSYSNTRIITESMSLQIDDNSVIVNIIQDLAIFSAISAGASSGTVDFYYQLLQESIN